MVDTLRVEALLPGLGRVMVAAAIAAFAMASPATSASTIRVPDDQPSIRDAIQSANPGDTVLVAPGTYTETSRIVLDKAITLASWYHTTGDPSYIDGTIVRRESSSADMILEVRPGATGATVTGFTFTRSGKGIVPTARFDLVHNVFRGISGDAVDYESGSGGLCAHNLFEDNSDDGIDLDFDVDIVIEYNTIRNNGDDGIERTERGDRAAWASTRRPRVHDPALRSVSR